MPRDVVPLLIVFADLTMFAAYSQHLDDREIADTLDIYYRSVTETIERAGGRVVKFIGDGVLIVFSEDAVDRGVKSLLELKKTIGDLMESRGWPGRLIIKAHFGEVVAGPFGPSQTFDVIGKNVNATAMLHSTGITLSATAFGKLSGELQHAFREITSAPIYVGAEDDPHFRRGR